jgi:hypothetical protein
VASILPEGKNVDPMKWFNKLVESKTNAEILLLWALNVTGARFGEAKLATVIAADF